MIKNNGVADRRYEADIVKRGQSPFYSTAKLVVEHLVEKSFAADA